MERNPYNSAKPGHLFTGYETLRGLVVRGLQNEKSFAVMGGRRCGKTSLLQQLKKDIVGASSNRQTLLARFVDMQGEIPKSAEDFFVCLSRHTVFETHLPVWQPAHTTQPYQSFLSYLGQVVPKLELAHGKEWIVVFLIDELEVAAKHLPSDECFQNLRNLLMTSDYALHFRVVVTGLGGLSDLITAGSPLNNLESHTLSHLGKEKACELIKRGFDQSLPKHLEEKLLELTGCHPWLLQGMLEYLWEDREHLDKDSLPNALRQFVRSRDGVFKSWAKTLDDGGRAVYRMLATTQEQEIRLNKIRSLIPTNATVSGILDILTYHGLIDELGGERIRLNGTIFKDWFTHNLPYLDLEPAAPDPGLMTQEQRATPAEERNKRVFVVYGRDQRFYTQVCRFLRALRLEPLEWYRIVEATGKGAPTIFEIIEKGFSMAGAAVVLLTPDDEARLLPHFHQKHDPSYEKELTPQPRPNVLFEAGLAMAKFRDKTIFVRAGHVRQFSDISGIHLVDLNNDVGIREHFARRLENCGLKVDLACIDWQSAGDLTPATSA